MKKVFSFTIFGSDVKYCRGLLVNLKLIHEKFPEFEAWVYIGDGVPKEFIHLLANFSHVRCFSTQETGMVNKFYRFFAIDDPTVELMIVRDVDSRLYERDISVISDFIASDKLFHIVRDHPNHFHKILAGVFAIRRGLLNVPLRAIFEEYRKTQEVSTFWNDQEFLASVFYPQVLPVAMIHDDVQEFEHTHVKTPIKAPIKDGLHFIGQVYEFDSSGNEYPKFTDFLQGGVHGEGFWTAERKQRAGIA